MRVHVHIVQEGACMVLVKALLLACMETVRVLWGPLAWGVGMHRIRGSKARAR